MAPAEQKASRQFVDSVESVGNRVPVRFFVCFLLVATPVGCVRLFLFATTVDFDHFLVCSCVTRFF